MTAVTPLAASVTLVGVAATPIAVVGGVLGVMFGATVSVTCWLMLAAA